MKPEVFLLNMIDKYVEKRKCSLYMIRVVRKLYAQYWKSDRKTNEWWMKLMDLAEVEKLTILLKKTKTFQENWKPDIDYLQDREHKDVMDSGNED